MLDTLNVVVLISDFWHFIAEAEVLMAHFVPGPPASSLAHCSQSSGSQWSEPSGGKPGHGSMY